MSIDSVNGYLCYLSLPSRMYVDVGFLEENTIWSWSMPFVVEKYWRINISPHIGAPMYVGAPQSHIQEVQMPIMWASSPHPVILRDAPENITYATVNKRKPNKKSAEYWRGIAMREQKVLTRYKWNIEWTP